MPIDPAEVCAIFTTFHPDNSFPCRVERIRAQTGLVIIVDDGATINNVNLLNTWFRDIPDIIVSHNPTNVG